jgi:hypothetical protein
MKSSAVLFGFVAALGLLYVPMSGAQAVAQPKPVVSFRRDVTPILVTSCMTGSCHGNGIRPPLLDRHDDAAHLRAALVGVRSEERPAHAYITPGAPEQSFLVEKIEGHLKDADCVDHDCGVAMPKDNPLLAPDARTIIRSWIAAGAPDN